MNAVAIRPIAEMEREAILQAVETVGNKLQAANLLGISKTSLYRKLKDFGYADRTPIAQSRALGLADEQAVLLRQAATLRSVPVRALPEREPVRFLQIPTTRIEEEQASLRCPRCRTLLIDATA